MTTRKLVLFLPILAMGYLTSCSTESVRTDEAGTGRNIGVDTINPSQLRQEEPAAAAPAVVDSTPKKDSVVTIKTVKTEIKTVKKSK